MHIQLIAGSICVPLGFSGRDIYFFPSESTSNFNFSAQDNRRFLARLHTNFLIFCVSSSVSPFPFTKISAILFTSPLCFNDPIIRVNNTFVKSLFVPLKHFVDIAHFWCYTNRIKGVNTLNERIKKVRKSLDLTQQEFADRLSIKRNTVATYERGKSDPSDAAVVLICKTFNVSETWLRTGEGEMFVPKEEDAWDEVVKRRGLSDGDRLLIEKFMNLKPAQREVVMEYVLSVSAEYSRPAAPVVVSKNETAASVPDTSGQERTQADTAGQESVSAASEAEARAKAELYYRQLLSEQEQARQASSAKESGAG